MEGKANGGSHPRQLKIALDDYLKRHNITTPTKRKRVLAWLRCASVNGHSVTRFDAEYIGDHCFNTTVSELGRIDGFNVLRKETKRPTRFGTATDCKEYWLPPEEIARADQFLGVTQ